MDTGTVLAQLMKIKNAFQIMAALNLTAHNYPPSSHNDIIPGARFDYIVVGAGTAGCVVANRLTEDPEAQVLLIEAGGNPTFESSIPSLMAYLKESSVDWNYSSDFSSATSECRRHRKASLTLGKMLGGSSGLNYMLYSQATRSDYHSLATAANDSSWEWNKVWSYIGKAERLEDKEIICSPDGIFHGIRGPIGLTKDHRPVIKKYLDAFKQVGHEVVLDVNAYHAVGYSPAIYNIAEDHQQNTAHAYLAPIKQRPNLHILKYTEVKQILFDENKNAIGVKAVVDGNRKIVFKARREVIISAGAINTPKLLMLSGVGPKVHLEYNNITVLSDLPVGRNLQDHVAVVLVHDMTRETGAPECLSPYEYPAFVFKGAVSVNRSDSPDYETLNFINYSEDLMRYCSYAYEFKNSICDSLLKSNSSTQMLLTLISNLRPKSRGHVLLRSSDYADPPIVSTEPFSDNEDLRDQVEYIKDFIRVTDSDNFKIMGGVLKNPGFPSCNGMESKSDEFWRCYALCMMMPQQRYCGTCAVGSVVDARLRVYGVQRLRVVDASVMATIPSGGTFGPTVVIGEKAADMIKQDHRRKST